MRKPYRNSQLSENHIIISTKYNLQQNYSGLDRNDSKNFWYHEVTTNAD